jgi:hypothetical protein
VAAIAESVKCRRDPGFGSRELEVRRVRAQELGAPSREVAKSRGVETVIGSGSREDRWIRASSRVSHIRRFGG